MHGILEGAAVLVFLGTLIVALAIRLSKPHRPKTTLLLIGLWPLGWGLLREGQNMILDSDSIQFWLVVTGIALVASLVGGAMAIGLLRVARKR